MKSQQIDPKALYANLMEEVNARIELISGVVSGAFPMHQMMAEEIGYFELRMTCEAIACGILVCHGDITDLDMKKLRGEWSADTIIKRLDGMHDNFFPQPRAFKVHPPSSKWPAGQLELLEQTKPHLTKAEFLKLYGDTHAKTHRGSLKQLGTRPPYVSADFTPIIKATEKIIGLMETHLIQSPDRKRNFIVAMKYEHNGGRPGVWLAEAP